MKETNEERQILYSFLAGIFRKEADKTLLESIKKLDYGQFDKSEENLIDKGFLLMEQVSGKMGVSMELNLARDYAKTFLGAGLGKGQGAYPYESYYTSPDRLLMQEARDKVMFAYGDEMLKRSDNFTEPEDHIAFELEFMAFLCGKTVNALENNNDQDAEKYLQKQKEFFTQHLSLWSDMFCDDVLRVSGEDFYKAAALILKGFIEEERQLFRSEVK